MPILHHRTWLFSATAEHTMRPVLAQTLRVEDAPGELRFPNRWGWSEDFGSLLYYRETTRAALIDRLARELSRICVSLEIPEGYSWRERAEERNAWLDEQFAAHGHETPPELRLRNRYFRQEVRPILHSMSSQNMIILAWPWHRGEERWKGHHSVMLKARF